MRAIDSAEELLVASGPRHRRRVRNAIVPGSEESESWKKTAEEKESRCWPARMEVASSSTRGAVGMDEAMSAADKSLD